MIQLTCENILNMYLTYKQLMNIYLFSRQSKFNFAIIDFCFLTLLTMDAHFYLISNKVNGNKNYKRLYWEREDLKQVNHSKI